MFDPFELLAALATSVGANGVSPFCFVAQSCFLAMTKVLGVPSLLRGGAEWIPIWGTRKAVIHL